MSFVYYSVLSTAGLPLITAQASLSAPWTTPIRLTALLLTLQSLDFADYTQRRRAIVSLRSLVIQQFAYTYPFDPLQYPIIPPATQVRFPGFSTYVYLPPYADILTALNGALAYRDTDGAIAVPLAAFEAAVSDLADNLAAHSSFFDRLSWELEHVLLWEIYPAIPLRLTN